jgi:hypothetical protein
MGPGAIPRKNKSATNRPEDVITSVRRKRQQSAQVLTFPVKPLSPHGIQFIFKEYNFNAFVASQEGRYGTTNPLAKYQKTNENDKKVDLKSTLTIELPFPTALTDATGLTISGIERDLVTAAIGDSLSSAFNSSSTEGQGLIKGIANRLQGIGSDLANTYQTGAAAQGADGTQGGFAGGAGAVAGKIYDQLSETLKISMDSAKLLGAYLARNFLGDISKTIAMDSAFAINPQETLAFEGVSLKQYTFDWDLYPSNKADSDRIKELVRKVKSRILPKMSGGAFEATLGEQLSKEGINVRSGALGRLFLSYPDTVIMNLVGVDESHWPLFKPAMCTGIDIDYAGGGEMVIAKGGVPAAIKLSMSFSELVIHTQDDYEDTPTVSPPDVEKQVPGGGRGFF